MLVVQVVGSSWLRLWLQGIAQCTSLSMATGEECGEEARGEREEADERRTHEDNRKITKEDMLGRGGGSTT